MTYSLFSRIKSEECDENGFLIKKEEYELKKDIKGMDYASFFEKEGWYNRSTGQTAFREEPYPLNTGEFTEMVMRCIRYTSNHSTRYIRITNIKKVPQQFLDKYGTIGEDGVKYLERRNSHSKWAKLDVVYIIDSETGPSDYCQTLFILNLNGYQTEMKKQIFTILLLLFTSSLLLFSKKEEDGMQKP